MSFWGKSLAKQLSLNSTVSKGSKSKKSDQKEDDDFGSVISSSASKPPMPYKNKQNKDVQDKLQVAGKERRRSNNSGSTSRGVSGSLGGGIPKYPPTTDGMESTYSRTSRHSASNTSRSTDIKVPVSAAHVLMNHRSSLTDYEQSEILQYQNVYYWGQNAKKDKKIKSDPKLPHNSGYDDSRADLIAIRSDHLAYRYEVLEVLGRGSFGQVLRCFDHKSKTMRAVKVIRNRRRFRHQAAQEIRMLEKLATKGDVTEQNNLVRKLGHFIFRQHLCISFELLSLNLYEVLRKESFVGMAPGLVRKICQQVLECLRYLQQHNVIHCDLKPENILLKSPNRPGSVKVVDFGSSCFEDERVFTYIQSRFYRAPEVILGLPYSSKIDMWSLGCVLAELHNGFPLFPGENEPEQLLCIMEVLDIPPDHLIHASPRKKLFFDSANQPRIVPGPRGHHRLPGQKTLQQVVKGADPTFIDFLERCLKWDANQRMTPQQALQHPWLQGQLSRGSVGGQTPVGSPHTMPHPPSYPGHAHSMSMYDVRKGVVAGSSMYRKSMDVVRNSQHSHTNSIHSQERGGDRDAGDGIARTLARQQSLAYTNSNNGVLLTSRSLKNVEGISYKSLTDSQQKQPYTINTMDAAHRNHHQQQQQKTSYQSTTSGNKLVRNFSLAPQDLMTSRSQDLVTASGKNSSQNGAKKNFFPLLFQRNKN